MFEFFRKKPPQKQQPGPSAPAPEVAPPDPSPTTTTPVERRDDGGAGLPPAPSPAPGHPLAPALAEPPAADAARQRLPATPDEAAPVETPSVETASVQTAPVETAVDGSPAASEARGWRERLKAGLGLSRGKLAGALTGVFRRRTLDDAALDELESALLQADVGVDATLALIEDLRERYRRAGANADPRAVLRDAMVALLAPLEHPLVIGPTRPFVIMLAGVNGAGKTTSIGKLARWLRGQGLTVLLAAGDTFRAAAREQLAAWGERNGVAVVQQQGGDPAAVIFDAIEAARARGIDVVLADTAGRLPTQAHLMDELRKIRRVIGKAREGAPHSVLLVLDANTGQNGLAQVKSFDAAVGLTGLVVTKLDGTAKGGVVAAIAQQKPVPLQFIGVGEGLDDLRPFVARDFVDALLPDEPAH